MLPNVTNLSCFHVCSRWRFFPLCASCRTGDPDVVFDSSKKPLLHGSTRGQCVVVVVVVYLYLRLRHYLLNIYIYTGLIIRRLSLRYIYIYTNAWFNWVSHLHERWFDQHVFTMRAVMWPAFFLGWERYNKSLVNGTIYLWLLSSIIYRRCPDQTRIFAT